MCPLAYRPPPESNLAVRSVVVALHDSEGSDMHSAPMRRSYRRFGETQPDTRTEVSGGTGARCIWTGLHTPKTPRSRSLTSNDISFPTGTGLPDPSHNSFMQGVETVMSPHGAVVGVSPCAIY